MIGWASAGLITRWLGRARALVVRAWAGLCAHTDDLGEKRRCLEAISGLDPNCELASTALQGILFQQQTATHLHPANAEAIAEFAEETGAEVLRGTLRYPSESGSWQLGNDGRHNMDPVRLKPSEKRSAAKVYARSFFDYPMVTHYWPDPNRRAHYLEWYLGCAIHYGLAHGEVYTTPDIAGVAVWLPPGQTHISTWRYIRAGFLALPFAMGIVQFFTVTMPSDNLVERVHEEIARGPHWYLWGLAVDPGRQGEGIGTMLMRPGLESADAQHLPCYLETHSEKNIAFYTKFGFDMVRTVRVPGSDLCFWCFLREPRGKPASVPA